VPSSGQPGGSGRGEPETIRTHRDRAGIFLDFDGTLSEIVAHPDLAAVLAGAPALLERLSRSYALVALVSGRPAAQVRELVPVPGIEVFGLYGLLQAEGETGPPAVHAAAEELRRLASRVAGAWVEDKGPSIAVHYRGAPDPEAAGVALFTPLVEVAERFHLRVLSGKMVLELLPAEVPGKGAVVLREVRERALAACLFAGDDRADLDAFAALDALKEDGVETVKVAVRSAETPEELIAQADLVVEGPSGLLEVLSSLVHRP
jgi:trehalose 6-phosphate phosphatase